MGTKIIACLLVVLLCFRPASAVGRPVIIVAGQSNAEGAVPYLRENQFDYSVVDCAVGRSSITEWQRGQFVYDDCVSRVDNFGREVAWIFFMQGEADSRDYEIAKQWKSLFFSFAHDFRVDIGYSDIPVIVAQIGTLPNGGNPRPYWELIQQKQLELPINHPALFVFTTSDIIPYCPMDGVHFCDVGYNEISLRAIETETQR